MKQITQLGTGGVNYDTPSTALPENMFTDVRNVRFNNNAVETIKGESVYRTLTNVTPDHGIAWKRPDGQYDIFLKDGKVVGVSSLDGTEYILMNSGSYVDSRWQTSYFNGGYAVIFNNGESTPLYILYGNGINALTEFPGWNYTSGTTVVAKVIRPLGYSLIAANLTTSSGSIVVYAPSTIRISVQADTGSFPTIWEPGLTTDTADEFEINSISPILDMAELRNNMYIYTEDSIHVVSISSGITRVQPYNTSYGILNTDCVVELDGKHIVVDKNDIYTHNGSGSIESLAAFRIKDYFFSNLNKSCINKVVMKRIPYYNEVWICYPKGVSTKCNEALIYNYKNNTWSIRDLPNIDYLFNSDNTTSPINTAVVYMVGGTTKVLTTDSGYQMWNGSALANFTSYAAREKINSGDILSNIHISSITPVLEDTTATTVNIHVVGSNNANTAVDWSNSSGRDITVLKPTELTNESYKVDPRVSGRLLSYKVSGVGYWRMPLIGLEVIPKDHR